MRAAASARGGAFTGSRERGYHRRQQADGGSVSHLVAYIDPGSGSLIIQVVIATLVAIPIFFRTQIGRIVNRFRGRTEVQASADDRADGD
jgi:hypothetical protein